MKKIALSFFFFFLFVSGVRAESYRLMCIFDKTFEKETKGIRHVKDGDIKSFEFNFDDVSGEAFVVANQGIGKVYMHSGNFGVSFYEPLVTGALQTTTLNYKTGEVVHSRHTMFGEKEKITISQTYGKCYRKDSEDVK